MLRKKIIFALCGLLPVFNSSAQAKANTVDKIVAVVGDQIILSSEIKNSLGDLSRQGTVVPANARCLLTEEAIISKLLMLGALTDSLPVTDEDVERGLDERLAYWLRQLGSREKVEEYAGKSLDQIKNDARASYRELLLADAMRRKITGGIAISPAEVKSFFEKISKDSLPMIKPEMEVGQIVFYPAASKDLEQYVINELNSYKKQVENKTQQFCLIADNKQACDEIKINRYSTEIDPAFITAAFHLKESEISSPVKCKIGFYLIQMLERKGDDATVRYIFRTHPVTDVEVSDAKAQLNVLRNDIIEKRIDFKDAASQFSENTSIKIVQPSYLNEDGSTELAIDQLDKDLVDITEKMSVGEISRPTFFVDEGNRKAVRLVYLKSRKPSHVMNLKEDYMRISQLALEEKRNKAIDKWISSKISTYFIKIDESALAGCPEVQRFASRN